MTFIGDTIYQLKREYGKPLKAGIITVLGTNDETGIKSSTTQELKISRAIRMPNQIAFDFLRSIGALKGGDIPAGSFQIIIDRKDVPLAFPIIKIDYLEYDRKTVNIIKIEDFDEAIIIFANEIIGAPQVGARSHLTDTVPVIETMDTAHEEATAPIII